MESEQSKLARKLARNIHPPSHYTTIPAKRKNTLDRYFELYFNTPNNPVKAWRTDDKRPYDGMIPIHELSDKQYRKHIAAHKAKLRRFEPRNDTEWGYVAALFPGIHGRPISISDRPWFEYCAQRIIELDAALGANDRRIRKKGGERTKARSADKAVRFISMLETVKRELPIQKWKLSAQIDETLQRLQKQRITVKKSMAYVYLKQSSKPLSKG